MYAKQISAKKSVNKKKTQKKGKLTKRTRAADWHLAWQYGVQRSPPVRQ